MTSIRLLLRQRENVESVWRELVVEEYISPVDVEEHIGQIQQFAANVLPGVPSVVAWKNKSLEVHPMPCEVVDFSAHISPSLSYQ